MAYGVNAPFGLRPISSITGGTWTEKVNEYYIYASTDGATTYGTSIFTGDPVVFTPTAANIVGGTANASVGGFITRYLPNFTDGTPSTFSALPLLGVFVGCEYFSTVNGTNNLIKSPFWPASTQVIGGTLIKAYVIDDPNVVYDIQVSSSINAAANAFVAPPVFPNTNTNADTLLKGAFGSNFALNVGGGTNFDTVAGYSYANNPTGGSTLTGQSAFYLDVCTSTALNNDHDYRKTTATLPLKVVGWSQDPNNVAAPGLTRATTPFLNVRVLINNHVYGHNVAGTTLG
jgi:hypothetical protein